MPLTYVLIFSLLGSVGALTGAGALLAFPRLHDRLKTILHHDSGLKKSLLQLAGLLAGSGTILLLHGALE